MKKIFSLLLAAVLAVGVAVPALADTTTDMPYASVAPPIVTVYDEDGDSVGGFTLDDGKVTGDDISPGKKYYVPLPDESTATPLAGGTFKDVYDSDNFAFKLDRDKNGKYLSSVKLVNKNLTGTRQHYIEVVLKETNLTDEVQVSFDVYFRAKRNNGSVWSSGDRINTRFVLWVNNDSEDGTDASFPTGEGRVFNPVSNETNFIAWGEDEDIADLKFTADSDADKFYVKLSTRINNSIYEEYGDPVDAELYFRSFAGSTRIDSTSRATLTLYNPWYDDDSYYSRRVNPREVYIYEEDSDGYLIDVTDQFTYVRDDDTEAGIDGWQTKVRRLGKYIISDTDLELDEEPVVSKKPSSSSKAPAPTPGTPTPSPNTGSSDLAAGAAALVVLSGAVMTLARKRKI